MPITRTRRGGDGSKGTQLTLDFTKVGGDISHGGGRAAHVMEGEYLLKLESGGIFDNKSGEGQHVRTVWEIVQGPEKSSGRIYHRSSISSEENLWNLRNIVVALRGGKPVPTGKAFGFDLAKYFGQMIGATLVDGEPYNDRIKSEIADVYPASEFESKASEDDEDEDEDGISQEESDDEDEAEEEIDLDDI